MGWTEALDVLGVPAGAATPERIRRAYARALRAHGPESLDRLRRAYTRAMRGPSWEDPRAAEHSEIPTLLDERGVVLPSSIEAHLVTGRPGPADARALSTRPGPARGGE